MPTSDLPTSVAPPDPAAVPGVVRRFFCDDAPLCAGDLVLVAFSGGPDSTALLLALNRLAPELGARVLAAHLDHGLDPDSGRRAEDAARLAAAIGVPFATAALAPASGASGESREATARRRRYAHLHRLAARTGARFVATAHHADDQAETVLLRLLYGSGIAGLAAIQPVRGQVVRPLLDVRRADLLAYAAAAGLEPVRDPTNLDLSTPRNRVRHRLLPQLSAQEPRTVARLCALAAAARAARHRLAAVLGPLLDVRALGDGEGAALDQRALARLPAPLLPHALALLDQAAGVRYPAGAPARAELRRQLDAGIGSRLGRARVGGDCVGGDCVGCDRGNGWRWEGDATTFRLVRLKPSPGEFAYTLEVPGVVEIPELALRVRLRRGKVGPWMFRGRIDRTGLSGPLVPGARAVVRNRRAGDRIQPLGGTERLRLKDLLIARRVPRHERDRLPLLEIEGNIAWVPGVTIDERFRLRDETSAWIAEIEPIENDPSPGSGRQLECTDSSTAPKFETPGGLTGKVAPF